MSVSVLVSGFDSASNPVMRAVSSYGDVTAVHVPRDGRAQLPTCDIAVVAVDNCSHILMERVKGLFRTKERPIFFAKGGFTSIKPEFEAVLAKKVTSLERKKASDVPTDWDKVKRSAEEAEKRVKPEAVVVTAASEGCSDDPYDLIVEWAAQGVSAAETISRLNLRGLRPRMGGEWTPQLVYHTRSERKNGARPRKAASPKVSLDSSSELRVLSLIDRCLNAASLTAEQRVELIHRIRRGEVSSEWKCDWHRDGDRLTLRRSNVFDPENITELVLSKAQAQLVVQHHAELLKFLS